MGLHVEQLTKSEFISKTSKTCQLCSVLVLLLVEVHLAPVLSAQDRQLIDLRLWLIVQIGPD